MCYDVGRSHLHTPTSCTSSVRNFRISDKLKQTAAVESETAGSGVRFMFRAEQTLQQRSRKRVDDVKFAH